VRSRGVPLKGRPLRHSERQPDHALLNRRARRTPAPLERSRHRIPATVHAYERTCNQPQPSKQASMAPKQLTAQQELDAKRNLVVVVVGASQCGKSSLLTSQLFNVFSSFYAPTLDQVFLAPAPASHAHLAAVTYVDVGAGAGASDRFVPLRVQGCDVVALAFSVVDRASLEHAVFRYAHYAADYRKPVVLVGLKTDLRGPRESLAERTAEVIAWEAERYAARIGATEYVECSAFSEDGLADVFEALMRAALGEQPRFAKDGGK